MTAVTARVPRSTTGEYARMYLELPVTPDAQLTALRARLEQELPGLELYPTERLHLTVLHLGRPQDLLAELRREDLGGNPHVSLPMLHRGLERIVTGWHDASWDWPKTAEADRMIWMAHPDARTLALGFAPGGTFVLEQRVQLRHDLLELLEVDCEIVNPAGFMARSDNLQFNNPAKYRPHVSLGFVPQGAGRLPRQMPQLEHSLALQLEPVRYRGFEFV